MQKIPGRKSIGDAAEQAACRYLQLRGLRVLCRNFRSGMGEIDLVMRDACTTVFVEVRLRQSRAFGGGAASVTAAKQRRLARAAAHYLQREKSNDACRFDVVEVRVDHRDAFEINWIRGAFATPDDAF
ncbi:MAG: YraN family protein [Pseudomonadales bacterium]